MMATIDHSKRAFFRRPSRLKENNKQPGVSFVSPQRPPWALTESLFVDNCSRCNECVLACEEEIIIKGDGGFPEIDFQRGECTFCEACVNACETKALYKQPNNNDQAPFYFDITIDDRCLAKQKIHCQSCKDVCDSRAIDMLWPTTNTIAAIQTPFIRDSDCTSCGACVSTCPSQSIHISPSHSPNTIFPKTT